MIRRPLTGCHTPVWSSTPLPLIPISWSFKVRLCPFSDTIAGIHTDGFYFHPVVELYMISCDLPIFREMVAWNLVSCYHLLPYLDATGPRCDDVTLQISKTVHLQGKSTVAKPHFGLSQSRFGETLTHLNTLNFFPISYLDLIFSNQCIWILSKCSKIYNPCQNGIPEQNWKQVERINVTLLQIILV